jgi:hypothetical protein
MLKRGLGGGSGALALLLLACACAPARCDRRASSVDTGHTHALAGLYRLPARVEGAGDAAGDFFKDGANGYVNFNDAAQAYVLTAAGPGPGLLATGAFSRGVFVCVRVCARVCVRAVPCDWMCACLWARARARVCVCMYPGMQIPDAHTCGFAL